jgi:predicted nucleotidyltransferase
MIVTLTQRKKARTEQIRAAVERLKVELADYATSNHGRFWLYGSAASGNLRYDSDADILVDFEPAALSGAITFAEDACARLGLKPDIKPKSWCKPEFLRRIEPKALVLP